MSKYETKAVSCGWGKTLSWGDDFYDDPATIINRVAVEGWELQETMPGHDAVMTEHCRGGTLVFRRERK